ncbi:MAG: hypothetical protein CND89_03040 [Marine Group II euryarchaeote MED-G38]|nr:hypothetical protein [Euryarchaeota archaeon]OUV26049.1 MAG: hypothetical protein CBC57_02950 [Euryarchaeota archaeon TMED97]PDH23036.1 MAG: hypothetical protein CND89_03040 [Marine Group II euryarchaeote MED-G38]
MALEWLLVKCDCGNYYGVKKNSRISCSRCGGKNEFIISHTFSTSKELHSAVSAANAPDEINQIINSKLRKIEKKRRKNNFENGNITKLQILMKNATNKIGILTLDNLKLVLKNNSIENIGAEELIQISESEGYIIRSGINQWTWL